LLSKKSTFGMTYWFRICEPSERFWENQCVACDKGFEFSGYHQSQKCISCYEREEVDY